ncbi:MAG: 50S ribosomal protein L15 [Thermoplasmata archaeon]|jgi:large subunit ribosomal protein L15|nr:50S ribosomal protein L15 [Thermoplasmata archaeon]
MPSRTRKFRGLRTHGRGIKAGRGAGKQGGRGNAGLHKYKFKSMLIYAPNHFGRHGFQRPPEIVARPTSINVGELDSFVPVLEAAGALSRDGEAFVADLTKAGVDRLLGKGSSDRSWKVIVAHATRHAREKVAVVDAAKAAAPASAGSP